MKQTTNHNQKNSNKKFKEFLAGGRKTNFRIKVNANEKKAHKMNFK